MTLKFGAICALAVCVSLPAWADTITITDPYMRVSSAMARSGAAFMEITNSGAEDDRLTGVRADIAQRVELHTHIEEGDIMRMVEVAEGFAIPAGATHLLARGGDHVMFLGLQESLAHGDSVTLTLIFEKAGEMMLTLPVDLDRAPAHGHDHGHGHSHGHGQD